MSVDSSKWWRWGRLTVAWALGLYLADIFVRMGWIKFDPDGFWTAAFERWGYPPWLRLAVGGLEVVGGISLVVPWLATAGGMALALVMSGAWVTRLADGRYVDVAWITFYGLACLWIAWEWRDFRIWKHWRR